MPTLGPLARAASTGTWPVRVTIHLYDPEKGRFQARAAALLQLEVPVGWMLAGIGAPPLRHVVLEDFDGDGTTDFACSPGPCRFVAWHLAQEGIAGTADFDHTFGEEVREVALHGVLDERGRTSLVLRGESSLFVLTPTDTPPAPPLR